MAARIKIKDKAVSFPRATVSPDFSERRAISSNPWEFVSLWLRKNANEEAQVYWDQAKQFALSSKELPVRSAPLPMYYSFLNATKALLEAKSRVYNSYHGLSGFDMRATPSGRIRLEGEGIKIKRAGVLPSLVAYLGEVATETQYSLANVLANFAFIHRSYSMSYGCAEQFLSIRNPRYVTSGGKAWFRAEYPSEHSHGMTLRTIPSSFSVQKSGSIWRIESAGTFAWSGARVPTTADLDALRKFHAEIRLDVNYIAGLKPLWYIKRDIAKVERINRNNLSLMYMAMHRLSEISRYKPIELGRMLDGPRNLIIHEFVSVAKNQFLDEIAAEITGVEITPAGVRQEFF